MLTWCPACGQVTWHDWYQPGMWVCVEGPHDPDTIDPEDDDIFA